MTEDEAKTRWCPFARVLDGDTSNRDVSWRVAGWNRFPCGGGPKDSTAYRAGCEMASVNCVASACMAWRESAPVLGPIVDQLLMTENPDKPEGFTGSEVLEVSKGFNRSFWTKRAPSTATGFCGLAGQPQ